MSLLKCYCKYCGQFDSEPRFLLSDDLPVIQEFLKDLKEKTNNYVDFGHNANDETDSTAKEWLVNYGIISPPDEIIIPLEVITWIQKEVINLQNETNAYLKAENLIKKMKDENQFKGLASEEIKYQPLFE